MTAKRKKKILDSIDWKAEKKAEMSKTVSDLREQLAYSSKRQLELKEEADDVNKKNDNLQKIILYQLESFVQEKLELEARIARLNLRIKALGFDPQSATAFHLNESTVPQAVSQAMTPKADEKADEHKYEFNNRERRWEAD